MTNTTGTNFAIGVGIGALAILVGMYTIRKRCAVGKPPPCDQYGDIDNDGCVTTTDVDLVNLFITGQLALTAEQQRRADVNGDGVVNVLDAQQILAYANGTISTFSVCS